MIFPRESIIQGFSQSSAPAPGTGSSKQQENQDDAKENMVVNMSEFQQMDQAGSLASRISIPLTRSHLNWDPSAIVSFLPQRTHSPMTKNRGQWRCCRGMELAYYDYCERLQPFAEVLKPVSTSFYPCIHPHSPSCVLLALFTWQSVSRRAQVISLTPCYCKVQF